jgi:phosphoribosyl-ATP pyrophosphohydrolase/phosphoribosyl-AMP cyclohydrolase
MIGEIASRVKWSEAGLAPALCQDAVTGQVLTLAWMNAESLRLTLEKRTLHFWSRSRNALWHKGETSGNYLRLISARLDCDADALLFLVRPDGPACHTGCMSCFFEQLAGPQTPGEEKDAGAEPTLPFDHNLLESIYLLILRRREENADESYVARLFRKGEDRVLEKIGEEAEEVAEGVKRGDPGEIAAEMADLWFHSLVALAMRGVPPGRVFAELARRFGKGGRPESEE